jgi:hypothetical protein
LIAERAQQPGLQRRTVQAARARRRRRRRRRRRCSRLLPRAPHERDGGQHADRESAAASEHEIYIYIDYCTVLNVI